MSTNKSTSAATVVVSANVRKWMTRTIIMIAIILGISTIVGIVRGHTTTIATVQKIVQQRQSMNVQGECPDVTSREMSTCRVTTEWSKWIRLADGARDNGMKICHSLGVQSERQDNGATLIRFKITSGSTDIKYRLYPLDTDCSIEGF